MNIKNMKQARQWVKDTPAKELDMSEYYSTRTTAAEKVIGGVFDAHFFLMKNGWLPCGTACCLAGLIHWNAATKKQLTEDWPSDFARRFLELDCVAAHTLFCRSDYYGRERLSQITKKDMLGALDKIIERGYV